MEIGDWLRPVGIGGGIWHGKQEMVHQDSDSGQGKCGLTQEKEKSCMRGHQGCRGHFARGAGGAWMALPLPDPEALYCPAGFLLQHHPMSGRIT